MCIFAVQEMETESNQHYERLFEKEFLPQIDALYTFAYHLTYNEHDANDLVQEAYLNAYRFIDKYQEGTNAKAWLFRILKNAFINQYRKKSKQPQKVDIDNVFNVSEEAVEKPVGRMDLRDELYQNLMGDEVTIALNSLSIEYRTVILLCDVEGFSYEEIAEILELPIGTVRSRLHRARNLLKEKLKKYGESLGYKDLRK